MLRGKESNKVEASYDRARGLWRVDLAESICGDTKYEAETKAERKLAFYHRAEEFIKQLQKELEKVEAAYLRLVNNTRLPFFHRFQ